MKFISVQAALLIGSTLGLPRIAAAETVPVVQAQAVDSQNIELSWTPSSGNPTSYKIQMLVDGAWTNIGTTSNTLSFRKTKATADTKYSFRIVPQPQTNLKSAAVSAVTMRAPKTLTVSSSVAAGNINLDFSWQDSSTKESGFRLEQAVGSSPFSLAKVIGTSSTGTSTGTRSAVHSVPINAALNYRFRVLATNLSGVSSASNEVIVAGPGARPKNLTYSAHPAHYIKDVAISVNTPHAGGGPVSLYSISPLLADGLIFDPLTGAISGTPTPEASAPLPLVREYQVTAANALGSTSTSLRIVIHDSVPNVLFSDSFGKIRRVDSRTGLMETFAGTNLEGRPSSSAYLHTPNDTLVVRENIPHHPAGTIFISDSGNHRVVRVSTAGQITTLSGIGMCEFGGDGGPAGLARLCNPRGLALDASGNLYIADTGNQRIRRISLSTGIIQTVAGVGSNSSFGDGGSALLAGLDEPHSVVVDSSGNIFIGTKGYLRKVSPNGIISRLLPEMGLTLPRGLALDSQDRLYYTNAQVFAQFAPAVRRINADGTLTTIAGGGYGEDGGPAVGAYVGVLGALAIAPNGDIYFADNRSAVRKVSQGIITTVAGELGNFNGQIAPFVPTGIAVDANQNVILADGSHRTVSRLPAGSSALIPIVNGSASSFSSANGTAAAARFFSPQGLAVDSLGNVYISDTGKILRVSPNTSRTVASWTEVGGESGRMTIDSNDNLYVTARFTYTYYQCYSNLRVTPGGASNIVWPSPGLNCFTNIPSFFPLFDITLSPSGTTLFSTRQFATVPTKLGVGSSYSIEQDLPSVVTLPANADPRAMVSDSQGNVYVADIANDVILKKSATSITVIAGTGQGGFNGDGPATSRMLNDPSALVLDRAEKSLYFIDSLNFRIRKIDLVSGTLTTVAGNGVMGDSGDLVPATSGSFGYPLALTLY